jgi:uncharacterized lipoprotein YajG
MRHFARLSLRHYLVALAGTLVLAGCQADPAQYTGPIVQPPTITQKVAPSIFVLSNGTSCSVPSATYSTTGVGENYSCTTAARP